MPKSEKGDNSAKHLQSFALDTICTQNIIILAQVVSRYFADKVMYGLNT